MVDTGVGNNDDPGLLERTSDVVGEVTGGEATGDSLGTSERSVLEDSTVTVRTGRDYANVVGVLDGSEDTSSEDNLLPSLADVDDVDSWWMLV